MNMNATRGEASTSAAASLAFVPRKLGSGGTRGRGRGLRPGLSSSSSSTSARPRPPPQLLPHDVDFPSDTLLHATLSLSLDLAGRVDVSEAEEQQKRKVVDRLVRRRLERLAPRTVDYVTLRRVTPGDESSCGGDEGQTLVECIIRSPSPLTARQLVDKYTASKATLPDPHGRRHRQASTSVTSLRLLTLPEQAAVWRDEVPKGVKTRARRRAKRRASQVEGERDRGG